MRILKLIVISWTVLTAVAHAEKWELESPPSCEEQLDPEVVGRTYARFLTLAMASERLHDITPKDQGLITGVSEQYVSLYSRPLVYQDLANELLRTGQAHHEGLHRAISMYLRSSTEVRADSAPVTAQLLSFTYERYRMILKINEKVPDALNAEERVLLKGIEDAYHELHRETPPRSFYITYARREKRMERAIKRFLERSTTAAPPPTRASAVRVNG